jgi:hypothetical protein
MANQPDLIKLAPTLSVEERYRILIPDCQRIMVGEKGLLSDSEIKALAYFEKPLLWEDYAMRIGIFKWSNLLWARDIDRERFAVGISLVLVSHQAMDVMRGMGEEMPDEQRNRQLETLRNYVVLAEEKLANFFAYREALVRLEQEVYGVPLLHEEDGKEMESCCKLIMGEIEHYNSALRGICEDKALKKYFKRIAPELDKYLVKTPAINEEKVEHIVKDIKSFAESDVNARK